MLEPSHIYKVNSQLVACEVLDSEAVIVNLSNGMYYTMDEIGGDVWQLIEQGFTLNQMISFISERYDVSSETVGSDLTELMNDLMEHELVVSLNGTSAEQPKFLSPPVKNGYTKPELMSYSDMNNVLALDPPLPELDADFESS